MPANFGKKADDYLKDLWENRAVGLPTQPLDALSATALAYLRDRYPYLQMISSKAIVEESMVPKFRKSPSGWTIHDYGQAMSTSPGKHLFGPGNPELKKEDKGEGGGEGGEGTGTLRKQSFDTAAAMVKIAIEKGWPGIELVSGTPFMQWAAWMAAQDKNYPLVGYQPSAEAKKRRERILRLRKEGAAERKAAEKRTELEGPEQLIND